MAISKAERRRLKAARSQVLREQAVEAGMALPPPPPQVAKAKTPMPAKKDKKRKATGDVQSFAPRGKILATGSARARHFSAGPAPKQKTSKMKKKLRQCEAL